MTRGGGSEAGVVRGNVEGEGEAGARGFSPLVLPHPCGVR